MPGHAFARKTYTKFTYCNVCSKLLTGITNQGLQCSACCMNVHRSCEAQANSSFICGGRSPPPPPSRAPTQTPTHAAPSSATMAATRRVPSPSRAAPPPPVQAVPVAATPVGVDPNSKSEHVFAAHTFKTPTNCYACKSLLVGVYKQGKRCSECGMAVHARCEHLAPTSCMPMMGDQQGRSLLFPKTLLAARNSNSRRQLDETQVANMQISEPTDFKHLLHGSFDPSTGGYAGVAKQIDSSTALIFGSRINSQPRVQLSGYDDRIPTVLVLLLRELRTVDGFNQEGVFRVSPPNEQIEGIKRALDSGSGLKAATAESGVTNPHVYASLIKQWFRSLPLDDQLLGAISPDQMTQLASVDETTPQGAAELEKVMMGNTILQEPHRSILVWLIDVMAMVVECEISNRMKPVALGVVFAPSLYQPNIANPMENIMVVKKAGTVLAKLITVVRSRGNGGRDPFGDTALKQQQPSAPRAATRPVVEASAPPPPGGLGPAAMPPPPVPVRSSSLTNGSPVKKTVALS